MKKSQGIQAKTGVKRSRVRLSKGTPTLSELVARVTPKNRYDQTDWGPEQGREKVFWRP
jgi:hypothetical protein